MRLSVGIAGMYPDAGRVSFRLFPLQLAQSSMISPTSAIGRRR